MEKPSIQRLCFYASSVYLSPSHPVSVQTQPPIGAFKVYGRQNYNYVQETVKALQAKAEHDANPRLRPKPYDGKAGMFPCRTFNFGKQTVTLPHVDTKNLAQGWCSITPLGRFNHKQGGHLVLWDFGLVIDFPPGSTILIPSSLFVHSNTPIQEEETRSSIVQYAAGGLVRWVNRGFQSDKDWMAKASAEDQQRDQEEQKLRWVKAAGMYTKVEELTRQMGACTGAQVTTSPAEYA